MNKKFLTAFLFGAAVLASTSTFVSCKDYSDEISDLQTQINNANALHATKAELAAAKAELEKAYKDADAELNTALENLKKASEAADKELADKLIEEVTRATARENALAKDIENLQNADKELNELIKGLQDSKLDKTAFEDKVKEIYTDLASVKTELSNALSKEIQDREDADAQLKKDLEDADKVLDGKISDNAENIKANDLAIKALRKDFEDQQKVCKEYEKKVDDILADYLTSKDKEELIKKIDDADKKLQDQIDALDKRVTTNETDIKTLKENVKKLQDEVAKINEELVVLNLLIKTSLRSLVFIPDSYYWGVEATEINYLEYTAYEVTKADAKVEDRDEKKMGGTAVRGHVHGGKSSEGSKVLSFAANYHLNPSSANLEGAKFALVTGDRDYVRTFNEADALLSIVGTPTASNGILNVQLNADKPELIKSVPTNGMVTIFATQVTLPKDGAGAKADTTITSDYATLYKSTIKNLVLSHVGPFEGQDNTTVDPNNKVAPEIINEHCGYCEYYEFNGGEQINCGNHLFATENELINACQKNTQFYCDYNSTLDLSKLVQVHYDNEDGTHMLMTPAKMEACGLKYKFELVGYKVNTNETSQSVHAAINPEDGITFRPQEAELVVVDNVKDYNQKAYGEGAQTREIIGRTPIVRVSLVDAENGTVYDYGYIKIEISEKKQTAPEVDLSTTIEYTGDPINYYSTCTTADWTLEKYWNNIENDILKNIKVNGKEMTQKEFVENYKNSGNLVENAAGDIAQYKIVDGAYVLRNADEYIGVLSVEPNTASDETNTFKWTVAGEYIVSTYYGKSGAQPALTTYAKFESEHPTVYPDIYVKLNTGVINVSAPKADAFDDAQKIDEYWYKVDGNGAADTGFAEIHAQTLTMEDEHYYWNGSAKTKYTKAEVLDSRFADVFVGNNVWYSNLDNLDKKNLDWEENTYGVTQTIGLYFSADNDNKVYASLDGKSTCTYTLKRNGDNQLVAIKKNATDLNPNVLVAWIDSLGTTKYDEDGHPYTVTAQTQQVHYMKNDVAFGLLNYAAHNNLEKADANGNKVLKAIIMMKATNSCGHELALDKKTFDVRFLRPINVTGNNKEIEDAKDKLQTIALRDLINLTDWRDYKFSDHLGYWNYYNIKSIKVVDASSNGPINAYIYTTMKGANFEKTQSTISNDVLFTVDYETPADKSKDSYGKITYKNLSNTVQEFTVRIPLKVEYEWGYVITSVDVKVAPTHSNAKKR